MANSSVPDCPGRLAPDQLKENHQEIITKLLQFEKSYLQAACCPLLLRRQMIVFRPTFFLFRGSRDFQIFCVLKATLINTDDNETKRFRFQCSVQLYTCFCLTGFPLTRNFHNGDDSFLFCLFFQSVFVQLYTKIKKNCRESSLFVSLPSEKRDHLVGL